VSSETYSQSNEPSSYEIKRYERLAKIQAIDDVASYDSFIQLDDAYYRNKFFTYFSTEATHFNDQLFSNSKFTNTLSIHSYYDQLMSDEQYISDIIIESNIVNVDCEINDADISLYTSEDGEIQFKNLSCIVIVTARKLIQAKDEFGLSFNEVVPLEFEIQVDIDKSESLTSKFLAINSSSDFNYENFDFNYMVFSKRDLGTYITKCAPLLIDSTDIHELYKIFNNEIIFQDALDEKDDMQIDIDLMKDSYLYKSNSVIKNTYIKWIISYSMGPSLSGQINSNYDILDGGGFYHNWSVDSEIASKNRRTFSFMAGLSHTKFSSEIYSNSIYLENDLVDPDGFSYTRQSTFSDLFETFSFDITSFNVGLAIKPTSNKKLCLSGQFSFPVLADLSYISLCSSKHQGYYNDLYGITINEDYIYDFGHYFSDGAGRVDDFNILNGHIKLSYPILKDVTKFIRTKSTDITLFCDFRINKLSFPQQEYDNLEINVNNLFSSSNIMDDFHFTYLGLGLALSIKNAKTTIPCKK